MVHGLPKAWHLARPARARRFPIRRRLRRRRRVTCRGDGDRKEDTEAGAHCVCSARWNPRLGPPARTVSTAIVIADDNSGGLQEAEGALSWRYRDLDTSQSYRLGSLSPGIRPAAHRSRSGRRSRIRCRGRVRQIWWRGMSSPCARAPCACRALGRLRRAASCCRLVAIILPPHTVGGRVAQRLPAIDGGTRAPASG